MIDIDIKPRSAWGARYADGAGNAPLPAAEGLFLHHTGGSARNGPQAVRDIESTGQQRFGYGMSYTWLISPDGTCWQGHTPRRQGTHTGGYNTRGRAVCLIGTNILTPEAADTLARLLARGVQVGWWPKSVLRPHSEVRQTACPGEVPRSAIPGIMSRARDILRGEVSPPADPNPTPNPAEKDPFMSLTPTEQRKIASDSEFAAVKVQALEDKVDALAAQLDYMIRAFAYGRAEAEIVHKDLFPQIKARATEIHRNELKV